VVISAELAQTGCLALSGLCAGQKSDSPEGANVCNDRSVVVILGFFALEPVAHTDGGGRQDWPAQEKVDSAPDDQSVGFLEPVHDRYHDGRDVKEPFFGLVGIVGIFVMFYPEYGPESPLKMVDP
jgi:hypothetical protein